MLDTILVAESEIARQVRAHRIGIEYDRIEERRERRRQRRLASSGQAHDQNLAHCCPLG